jgi:signal transduction histidine kinase
VSNLSADEIAKISKHLREWIHDINNALFVVSGNVQELQEEISQKTYLRSDFDHEGFCEIVQAANRGVVRFQESLQLLRTFAKVELFENAGLPPPGPETPK